jgi:hypothetical protein
MTYICCKKCKKDKDLDEFYKGRLVRDTMRTVVSLPIRIYRDSGKDRKNITIETNIRTMPVT